MRIHVEAEINHRSPAIWVQSLITRRPAVTEQVIRGDDVACHVNSASIEIDLGYSA